MRLLSVGIPIIWLMIFSVAADMELENTYDYEAELNRILEIRTELLNQSYYGDSEVESEVKDGLADILAEPMLSQDIDNLYANRDTDFERVLGHNLIEYQLLSVDSGGTVIRAVIQWITDNDEPEPIYEYTVVLQHTSEENVKMSGFYQEAEISAFFLRKKKEIEI